MLERLARHSWMQIALVVLVAACVYLPFLGVRPLDFSEGHRAVPGWTMLESHDFWHQKMFGLTYIRKPPGIAWAIAASSAWLGETPLAARLPSALAAMLMSGLAWWYGRRWFGVARAFQPVGLAQENQEHGLNSPCHGLAGVSAGLAQALMPLMWSPGRMAEIEMLNNLGTQMFALGLIDLMAFRGGKHKQTSDHDESPFAFLHELCASARDIFFPALGIAVAALAKGPASAPMLAGVLIGGCIAAKSIRPLATRGVWIALLIGVSAAVVLLLKFFIANDTPDAVREDVAGQFLWSGARVLGVVTLLPVAFASAMPAAMAIVGPFMRGVGEREVSPIARTLAWAWIVSVLVLMCAGVSNARYAMPAAVLLPPLVPFAIAGIRSRTHQHADSESGIGAWLRRKVVSPVVWMMLMMLGAWWFLALTSLSPTQDQKSSVAAASHLAGLATDKGEVWADDAIEARPDVVWQMQQESPWLHMRWAKQQTRAGELPPPGDYLLIRTDPGSAEGAQYEQVAKTTTLIRLGAAQVRRYEFTLYRVRTNTWPLPP